MSELRDKLTPEGISKMRPFKSTADGRSYYEFGGNVLPSELGAVFTRDQWKQVDDAVEKAVSYRWPLVRFLREQGLKFDCTSTAKLLQDGTQDPPSWELPLPITWSECWVSRVALEKRYWVEASIRKGAYYQLYGIGLASEPESKTLLTFENGMEDLKERNLGEVLHELSVKEGGKIEKVTWSERLDPSRPIDTAMFESSARRVAEKVERTTVEALKKGVVDWPPDVWAMKQGLHQTKFYGPYLFLHSKGFYDESSLSRLVKSPSNVVPLESANLTDESLLIQLTRDVVRMVVALEPVVLQGSAGPKVEFKVVGVVVPQVRRDFHGNVGIVRGVR